MNKSEISLLEIFRILKRRKNIIIISILISLLVVLLYNFFRTPTYRSIALLKKEHIYDNNNQQDKVREIISLQSRDVLETEMELVKTRDVLNNVIDDLSLNIIVTKVVLADGTVTALNESLLDYQYKYNLKYDNSVFPKINSFDVGLKTQNVKFVVTNDSTNSFSFAILDSEFEETQNEKYSELDPSEWRINIEWPSANSNTKIYFESMDYNKFYESFSKSIEVYKRVKTNIFEISAESPTAYAAKTTANAIAVKFRENRIAQQKDNIHTSFKFVDDQLKEISLKLDNAENELSFFKSSTKIANIDSRSKSIVDFLSTLEAEKLKTDLELTLYKNKSQSISKEVSREGYVDQTYLTPEKYQSTNSPFSELMTRLSTLELEKLELTQRRKEIHPDVVLLTEQINKVKNELSQYNRNTVTAFNIMATALQAKRNNITNLIYKYSKELENLPEQENQLAGLIRQKNVYDKMFSLLLSKREDMRIAELSKMQDISILDYAQEPHKATTPNKKLNLLLGGLFGLVLGLLLAFVKDLSNKEINDVYEIERDFDFPILSVIPPYEKNIAKSIDKTDSVTNRFITMMEDKLKYKEAFRTFESKLSALIYSKPKTVMITSCEENAGKSSSAANLAITVAQSGKKVLLIDCDIKKPRLADLFGLPKYSSGLVDYLTEKTETPNIYKPVKLTKNSNLLMNIDIIPTGVFSNISGEVLASERMKKLLENLEYYDFVILDTPPITRLSDALSLGRIVKNATLVIRPGQTVKESISWTIKELEAYNINFLGALVNDCAVKTNSFKYQYGYVEKV
ncbi:MAG: polysaccharide biosynthesis tyrosine autokinase [Ignavibacteriae bacterium]|nr:polysaccharide biosynthesis tyrosine autokinase [Ignavibacteriota bacterium]